MGHSDPVTRIEKLMVAAAFLIVMVLVSGCATPGPFRHAAAGDLFQGYAIAWLGRAP